MLILAGDHPLNLGRPTRTDESLSSTRRPERTTLQAHRSLPRAPGRDESLARTLKPHCKLRAGGTNPNSIRLWSRALTCPRMSSSTSMDLLNSPPWNHQHDLRSRIFQATCTLGRMPKANPGQTRPGRPGPRLRDCQHLPDRQNYHTPRSHRLKRRRRGLFRCRSICLVGVYLLVHHLTTPLDQVQEVRA